MRQMASSTSQLADSPQRLARENLVGLAWITLVIGTGYFVLHGITERVRRDECVMRSAALCADSRTNASQSQRQTLADEQHVGIAAYLKGGRDWSDLR